MIRCDNDFGKSNNGGDSDAGFDVVNDNDDVVLIGYVRIERKKKLSYCRYFIIISFGKIVDEVDNGCSCSCRLVVNIGLNLDSMN